MLREWKGRLFVFDHKLEVAHKLGWKAQRDPEQMKAALAAGLPVVFFPGFMFPGDRPAAFDFFCRWVFEVSSVLPGKKLAAIDEIQQVTRIGQGGVPQSFQQILDDGRLRGIDLLLIAQKPNKVNDEIRGQLTEIISFKHTDRLPLQWLEEDGFNPQEVSQLTVPGGYIRRNLDTSEQSRGGKANAPDDTRKTSLGTRRKG